MYTAKTPGHCHVSSRIESVYSEQLVLINYNILCAFGIGLGRRFELFLLLIEVLIILSISLLSLCFRCGLERFTFEIITIIREYRYWIY